MPKPYENALRCHMRLRNASRTRLARFSTPKWLPKRGPWGVFEALKNDFFSMASQVASRMGFGSHSDPLELDFETFLDAILAWKFNPKCVCLLRFALHFVLLRVLWFFMLVSIRDIFLAVLGIADHKVDYSFFPTSNSDVPRIIVSTMSTDMQHFAALTAVWFSCVW